MPKTLDEALDLIEVKEGRSMDDISDMAKRYAPFIKELAHNKRIAMLLAQHMFSEGNPELIVFGAFVSGFVLGMEMEKE